MKNTTKNSKHTFTPMSKADEVLLKIIMSGKLKLSGFEKLIYEAGRRSVKCPQKL